MDPQNKVKRRESQKDWYHNRGRVRMNIPCSGTGKPPLKITFAGDFVFGGQYNKPVGDLPKGICQGCGDELSLTVKPKVPNSQSLVRKHKDPNAPYRRKVLITEESFGRVSFAAAQKGMEVDEYIDQLITETVPAPGSRGVEEA